MNHLPLPRNPTVEAPFVTLYEDCGYDGGRIETYLDRRSTSEQAIVDQLASSNHDARHAAHGILQTWLFFGVLSTVLSQRILPKELMGESPSGRGLVVDTSKLPELVRRWIAMWQAAALGLQRRRSLQAQTVHLFRSMSNIYLGIHLRLRKMPSAAPSCLDGNLSFSIALLYDYLYRAGRIAFGPWNDNCGDGVPANLGPTLVDSIVSLENKMVSNGWCRAGVRVLKDSFNDIEIWFISFLDHPDLEKDHSRCTASQCSAYHIDGKTYQTKHTRAACECGFVYASQTELSNILLGPRQAIPLVRPMKTRQRQRDDSRHYVDIIPSNGDGKLEPYVAISHVWSDGLGNNQENAIPECQFRRISELVSNLCGRPVAFWIDTLCFPLEPAEAYDMALVRMKESYELASKVLVLDQYLLGVRAGDLSLDEAMARIVISPWNRRLWTLQEAHLAKHGELYIQFRDWAIRDHQLLEHACRRLPAQQQIDASMSNGFYVHFYQLRSRAGSSMEHIFRAKNVLTYRSTSNAEDEGLCLGNILGLDPKPLVSTRETYARMRVFWDLAIRNPRNCHASIIFWAGPKLPMSGYRWAPTTFMDGKVTYPQANPKDLDGLVLGNSKDGLHVRLPALELKQFILKDDGPHFLRVIADSRTKHYALSFGDYGAKHTGKSYFSKTGRFLLLLPLAPHQDLAEKDSADFLVVKVANRHWFGSSRVHLVASGVLTPLDNVAKSLLSPGISADEGDQSLRAANDLSDIKNAYSLVSLIKNNTWYVD